MKTFVFFSCFLSFFAYLITVIVNIGLIGGSLYILSHVFQPN